MTIVDMTNNYAHIVGDTNELSMVRQETTMPSIGRDPRTYALLLAATLTVMSNATISPALPGIEEQFSATPDAALLTRLLVTAPSLTVALLAPFAGLLADRLGRRVQLLLGVALYALAGTAGFWLGDLHLILASRLVLGVAVALIMTSQTALIGDYFEADQRGRFTGYQIAATNFGGFVFIGLAGYIASISSTATAPFMIYALAGIYLPIIWAFTDREAGNVANGRPRASDRWTPEPWKMSLAWVALLASATFALFYIIPTQLPYYLASRDFAAASASAQVIGVLTLAGGVSGFFFGKVRAMLGRATTPTIGYSAMAAGFALLAIAPSLLGMSGAGLLVGIGVGLVMPNFITLAFAVVPPHRRGVAGGIMTSAIFLGQFASPLISQPVLGMVGYPELLAGTASLLLALAAICLMTLGQKTPVVVSRSA